MALIQILVRTQPDGGRYVIWTPLGGTNDTHNSL
jgi:hypothetical protein